MAATVYTIKVKAGDGLMNRIREACDFLEVTPSNFVEYAIKSELQRQEALRIREDITMEEIKKGILAAGQSLELQVEAEPEVEGTTCELCLTPIVKPKEVQGPLLCENCLDLAKGPKMGTVEPGA